MTRAIYNPKTDRPVFQDEKTGKFVRERKIMRKVREENKRKLRDDNYGW